MRMPMTAEDILVGIFYFLKHYSHVRVTADREILHRAFYSVRAGHPKVMEMFSFRERELFPESTQLDQALSNLDAAGLISRQNLMPRYYQFESPLEKCYDKFSREILQHAGIDEREISSVAKEIEQQLTTENS